MISSVLESLETPVVPQKRRWPILWRKDVSLLLGTGLGALSTVFAAGLITVRNTLGIQSTTDDVVTDTGQLYAEQS